MSFDQEKPDLPQVATLEREEPAGATPGLPDVISKTITTVLGESGAKPSQPADFPPAATQAAPGRDATPCSRLTSCLVNEANIMSIFGIGWGARALPLFMRFPLYIELSPEVRLGIMFGSWGISIYFNRKLSKNQLEETFSPANIKRMFYEGVNSESSLSGLATSTVTNSKSPKSVSSRGYFSFDGFSSKFSNRLAV